MRIAVCIATYRRPVMLGRLLDSLERVEVPNGAALVVVVVNNDTDSPIEAQLAERGAGFPHELLCDVESTRNIALARNRCIRIALAAEADWVALIDDDETASPRWLVEMMRVVHAYGADVVGGRVMNDYPDDAPEWVVRAGLPDRLHLPTGTRIPVVESCNALMSRAIIERVPGLFDERFGISGGSDSLFFLRARLAGARMVWADEAVVRELVPLSRLSMGWMLRRAFRVGNCAVQVARAELPVWGWLPRRFAAACYRILRGALLLVVSLARGRGAMTRALQDVCIGGGALSALAGHRYVEYDRTHGG